MVWVPTLLYVLSERDSTSFLDPLVLFHYKDLFQLLILHSTCLCGSTFTIVTGHICRIIFSCLRSGVIFSPYKTKFSTSHLISPTIYSTVPLCYIKLHCFTGRDKQMSDFILFKVKVLTLNVKIFVLILTYVIALIKVIQ